MCGMLKRHMYGTRMAADGWQEEYSTLLVGLEFRQGQACPNVFHHRDRQVVCSVHGDDFTSCGPKPALDWMESKIGEAYEISIGPRLGPGPDDAKEARALNRVIRWREDRIDYEADPRQVERLVAECGLEGAKAMATPGVKPTFKELEDDQGLPNDLHTAFRAAAARSNYLAADRIDAQYACKEICRWMSKPSAHSWKALKRLCRFFNGAPRLVYSYRPQSVECIDVYTDTDWAGCPKTRKSTSGGCVLFGSHAMKHWSSTQASVALSSGEAEFAGVIRGAGQGLGYQALLADLGVSVPLRVWTDSSAAIGICSGQGLGKMRHLDAHTLLDSAGSAVRAR
jgi:histone deacetylase 1/2